MVLVGVPTRILLCFEVSGGNTACHLNTGQGQSEPFTHGVFGVFTTTGLRVYISCSEYWDTASFRALMGFARGFRCYRLENFRFRIQVIDLLPGARLLLLFREGGCQTVAFSIMRSELKGTLLGLGCRVWLRVVGECSVP